MMEFLIVLIIVFSFGIILAIIDWFYGKNCPKCGSRMVRRFNYENDCEEYKCVKCQYKEVVDG